MADFRYIGKRIAREDALGFVTGRSLYVDDYAMPGMLTAKLVRSSIHSGRITNLNLAPALQMPGVVAVATAEDMPHNINPYVWRHDQPVFAIDNVGYIGQPIAAVAAVDEATAKAAVSAIEITYEEQEPVFDQRETIKPDAPYIYGTNNLYEFEPGRPIRIVRTGDVDKGFAESDIVIESEYMIPTEEHMPLEPQGSLAYVDAMGRLVIYTTSQQLTNHQAHLSALLELPLSCIRLIGPQVGGAFGGKNDPQVDPYTAILALKTKRPVKLVFTRQEETCFSTVRGNWRILYKDGVKMNGRLTARYVKFYLDAGAYAGLSPYCVEKACGLAGGVYHCPNVWVDGVVTYTNNPKSSSLRGLGVFSAMYGGEIQMTKLAEAIGMDQFEFRLRNAFREGDVSCTGMPLKGVAAVECLQKVADMAGVKLSPELQAATSAGERSFR